MLDLVHRLFGDVRPIDWVIAGTDFLVLVAILFFEIPEWWHKHKAKRFARAVVPHLTRGQEIANRVPRAPSAASEQAWIAEAKAWVRETEDFLSSRSQAAFSSFCLTTLHGTDLKLQGYAGDVYQEFRSKLQNLHRISEHPELFA